MLVTCIEANREQSISKGKAFSPSFRCSNIWYVRKAGKIEYNISSKTVLVEKIWNLLIFWNDYKIHLQSIIFQNFMIQLDLSFTHFTSCGWFLALNDEFCTFFSTLIFNWFKEAREEIKCQNHQNGPSVSKIGLAEQFYPLTTMI